MRRMAKVPVRASTPEMGPPILVSGYLTKRTRAMNRWKKRWWQLFDDGTLLYFRSEERAKALGEIDVARSCYDVRLGAHHCRVQFPSVVPSCCCFSFSVLKRTYYLFASTAAEAKRWVESISRVSLVLNYRKKTAQAARPAPCAPRSISGLLAMSGVSDEFRAHYQTQGKKALEKRYSLPNPKQTRNETEPACTGEEDDRPTELPQLNRGRQSRYTISGVSHDHQFISAPDLHVTHPHHHPDPSTRLWLDGSPQPVSRGAAGRRPDREGAGLRTSVSSSLSQQLSSSYSENLNQVHLVEPLSRTSSATVPMRAHGRIRSLYKDANGHDLPPRAQSADAFSRARSEKKARFSLQQDHTIPVIPFLSQESGRQFYMKTGSVKKRKIPPPVKPKPILKKNASRQTIRESEDITTPHTFNESSPNLTPSDPPAIPPKPQCLKVSIDCSSGQRNVFLPLPPNFKPPPPPDIHSENSSSHSSTGNEGGGRAPHVQTVSGSSLNRRSRTQSSTENSSFSRKHKAENLAWEQLHQVIHNYIKFSWYIFFLKICTTSFVLFFFEKFDPINVLFLLNRMIV